MKAKDDGECLVKFTDGHELCAVHLEGYLLVSEASLREMGKDHDAIAKRFAESVPLLDLTVKGVAMVEADEAIVEQARRKMQAFRDLPITTDVPGSLSGLRFEELWGMET